eukprot:CAMPEP_0174363858 /NCGR_PEP_ID=MMETSP0811_2-20130205/70536_1 /TAXON_ID=73025 ORGANISM="Eutreptiella gymnastica-like, Strain CCMP1594" /NCGR_SAMPLE_ID=MMETSP0811_2 /ASSEMBLY_ACC=CAM_ASM_000667 /LENGTH=79 /DNA_ID=CAMNT_0015502943 /DNA_START=52 /DNA_END=291 /DNA_ORIENTATION=+
MRVMSLVAVAILVLAFFDKVAMGEVWGYQDNLPDLQTPTFALQQCEAPRVRHGDGAFVVCCIPGAEIDGVFGKYVCGQE